MRFMRDMGISHEVTNVNGGAIAMGHPLGATGAMILGTLVDELARRDLKRGLATLCVGGGMGIATDRRAGLRRGAPRRAHDAVRSVVERRPRLRNEAVTALYRDPDQMTSNPAENQVSIRRPSFLGPATRPPNRQLDQRVERPT